MQFPESLNIGGMNYAIQQRDNEIMSAKGLYAQINFLKLQIEIDESLADPAKAFYLLHEVLHGAFHHAGLELDTDGEEERVILALTPALFRFFQDNDISWLKGESKNECGGI
jgi:hypothetical protein